MPFIARTLGGKDAWPTLAPKRDSVEKSPECSTGCKAHEKADFYRHMERWEYSNPEKYQAKSSIKAEEI